MTMRSTDNNTWFSNLNEDLLSYITVFLEPEEIEAVNRAYEEIVMNPSPKIVQGWLDSPIKDTQYYDFLLRLPETWFEKNKQNKFCRRLGEFVYGDKKIDEPQTVTDPEEGDEKVSESETVTDSEKKKIISFCRSYFRVL